MAFKLTQIYAACLGCIPVKVGGVLLPEAEVWSLTHPCDPTVLRTKAGVGQNLFISVRFTFDFRDCWIAPGSKYRISGRGPGGEQINSRDQLVSASGVKAVSVMDLELATPVDCTIPFGGQGAWTWTLIHVPSSPKYPKAPEEHCIVPLELYFYPAKLDPMFDQGMDVELIRMVIPPYQVVYSTGVASIAAAYAYTVQNIFNHGNYPALKYDVRAKGGGGSHYITQPPSGEVMHVTLWLRRTIEWLNCYDLAAICSVALRAYGLQDDRTIQILDHDWIRSEPFGYIPDGPLFGWDIQEDRFQTCNNPFWLDPNAARGQPYPLGPTHIDPADKARTYFGAHWFTWVPNPAGAGDNTIMDACHSIGPAPAGLASGKENLDTYFHRATQIGCSVLTPPNLQIFNPLAGID